MRYCCDNKCEQGRKCPANVAKVGARYPRHASCEPQSWREFMPKVVTFVLAVIFGSLVLVPLAYLALALRA